MDVTVAQKYFHRENDLISIIIPCYNREDYIKECLDSIFSQTAPPSLYEVICVDDGSTDNTTAIIKQYEEKYPDQLLLIECKENSGGFVGKVRNIGMQYASGTYLMFIDSDDLLAPNALEKFYLGALISQAEIVSSDFCLFCDNQILGNHGKLEFIYNTDSLDHFIGLQQNEGDATSACGKLYSRNFLIQHNIRFSEDLWLGEDNLFHENTLACVHIFYSLSDKLYYYRKNPNGKWNSARTCQYIKDCFLAQEKIFERYKSFFKPSYAERYHENFDEIYAQKIYLCLCEMMRKCEEYGQKSYFCEIFPVLKEKTLNFFPDFLTYSFLSEDETLRNMLCSNI